MLKIFLIDFGSAYFIKYDENNQIPILDESRNSEEEKVIYRGSIQFAALEILQVLARNPQKYILFDWFMFIFN